MHGRGDSGALHRVPRHEIRRPRMAAQTPLRVAEGGSMDKEEALAAALGQLERSFGQGTVMRGRIIEIFGPESSGKTTLALHVVSEAQRSGGICAFVDAEHALDPNYARKLGVKVDELLISQPDSGEQALEIADTLVRSGAVD